jgi:hypothetical protein
MKHLVALLLCAPAAAQESAPAPDSGEQWKKYDWVEVQAGDDVITYSDVIRHTRVAIERHMVSVTTRADMERLMHKTLEDLVLMALEAQAGEDRELSPVDIEDRIDRFLSDRRRDTGVVDYVEQLEASGVSPLRERELQKSGYYYLLLPQTRACTARGRRATRISGPASCASSTGPRERGWRQNRATASRTWWSPRSRWAGSRRRGPWRRGCVRSSSTGPTSPRCTRSTGPRSSPRAA